MFRTISTTDEPSGGMGLGLVSSTKVSSVGAIANAEAVKRTKITINVFTIIISCINIIITIKRNKELNNLLNSNNQQYDSTN